MGVSLFIEMSINYFTLQVVLLIFVCSFAGEYRSMNMNKDKQVRYVALGDSYTICEGASWEESWPVILTEKLNKAGISISLIANPSRTGWTTQDLIDKELAVFDSAVPTFVTLLIGVNDWVQGVDAKTFHKNLNFIIDHVQKKLPDKERLLLITIPDFSVTPDGPKYAKGRNISEGLTQFNTIIIDEAKKRDLAYVDIFPVSLNMKNNSELVSKDNLHPSAKEYAIWEELIYPAVYKLLNK